LPLSVAPQIIPLQSHHLPALSAFDTPIFGADRQVLFKLLLQEFSNRAFLAYEKTGRIVGYLFAQPNLIGPWIAATSEVAERLLIAALSLPFNTPPIVIAPSDNPFIEQLLLHYGFTPPQSSKHCHMIRGGITSNQRHNICGLAHFSLG